MKPGFTKFFQRNNRSIHCRSRKWVTLEIYVSTHTQVIHITPKDRLHADRKSGNLENTYHALISISSTYFPPLHKYRLHSIRSSPEGHKSLTISLHNLVLDYFQFLTILLMLYTQSMKYKCRRRLHLGEKRNLGVSYKSTCTGLVHLHSTNADEIRSKCSKIWNLVKTTLHLNNMTTKSLCWWRCVATQP